MKKLKIKPWLGVVGGMGPLAGVMFQKILIESTPVNCDQDHFPVVCVTNSQIPDRTLSLEKDGGQSYVKEILKTLSVLKLSGADLAVIPCHTAHVKFAQLEEESPLPLLNLPELVEKSLGSVKKVAVLATDGTIKSGLYQKRLVGAGFQVILPNKKQQKTLMELIYQIKAGQTFNCLVLEPLLKTFMARGVERVILACTELSLLTNLADQEPFLLDPLQVLADSLIAQHG